MSENKENINNSPVIITDNNDADWNLVLNIEEENIQEYQNIKYPSVFKVIEKGNIYYLYTDGKEFSDDGGLTWFRNGDSTIKIQLPFYVPENAEKVYIERDDYHPYKYTVITDEKEIEEIRKKSLKNKKLFN